MAIAFPAVHPTSVEVVPFRSQIASQSPSSLISQVEDRGGFQYRIAIRFDDMDQTAAALVCAFIASLQGMRYAFDFDLDLWCPGITPAPGVKQFKLSSPNTGWTSKGGVSFSCQFSAVSQPWVTNHADALALGETVTRTLNP
jgi:hypothetical protein